MPTGSYIEQYLIEINPGLNRNDWYSKVRKEKRNSKKTIEQVICKEDFVLVEANMGTGKTTLLTRLAQHYAQAEVYNEEKLLPIFITAKDYIKKLSEINGFDLIKNILKDNSLSPQKRYLVLIDALDEGHQHSDERISFISSVRELYQSHDNV
ncbi:hypothetical protein [Vreelandella boliviensis]|uniref:hypothetical protein n=1 Tax=Vreelandella boliviensis TaxID=223527 RepID=UPI001B8CCE44|nr:hypothetical protein [Halomonas boliviensis]MBS3667473.1 hypothetical protein [Halomonas boliviensis]